MTRIEELLIELAAAAYLHHDAPLGGFVAEARAMNAKWEAGRARAQFDHWGPTGRPPKLPDEVDHGSSPMSPDALRSSGVVVRLREDATGRATFASPQETHADPEARRQSG
jgi:hypothetical protein